MSKVKVQDHHFNVDEAIQYGVNKAILLHNLRFWLIKNKANKKHRHKYTDGKTYYWTYNSGEAFGKLFPYLKPKSILKWLKELEKDGVLLSGNFNKTKYDHTKWYTIKAEFGVKSKSISQKGKSISTTAKSISTEQKPIPYKKPDKKPNNNVDKSTISNLLKDNRRHIHIIGLFFQYKGFKFENDKQSQATIKRYLKPASNLIGYSDKRITQVMKWLDNNLMTNSGKIIKWELETVFKYVNVDFMKLNNPSM